MRTVPVRARVVAVGLGAMLALGACSWRPSAAEVDGERVELSALQDDLAVLDANPTLNTLVFGPDATTLISDSRAASQVTTFLLTREIQTLVLRDEAGRRGIEITDADRDALREQVEGQLEQGGVERNEAVDRFVAKTVDNFLLQQKFCEAAAPGDNAGCSAAAIELFTRADIKVNPRYGSWLDDQLSVVQTTPAIAGAA